jgi:type III pantothenate kinase
MLLVLDVGNSQTVVGLYEGEELRAHYRVSTSSERTDDEWRAMLTPLLQRDGVTPQAVTGCCISSVVPPVNRALQQICRSEFEVEPVVVGPGIKTGIQLRSENPKEVGADRIVNIIAAVEEHEGALIVIDFGTATTFDYVTEKRERTGGIIVPGVQLAADALFDRCALLPRVDITLPDRVIGRDTASNIRSGLTYGYGEMVDGLVRRIGEETQSEPKVVATGGLATIVAEAASLIDVVDPFLTLKGLRAVYSRNEKERN